MKVVGIIFSVLFLSMAGLAQISPTKVMRISVSPGGGTRNGDSDFPHLSNNGRFIVFRSSATNLVKGDTNGKIDIFVRDLQNGQIKRASVSYGMDNTLIQSNADGAFPRISDDGQFVSFESKSSNLTPNITTTGITNIFVHDMQTGQTERVSVNHSPDGKMIESNADCRHPTISGDGRFVVFESKTTNLVSGIHNGKSNIFLFDRQEEKMSRISLGFNGSEADGDSLFPTISADGHFVVFESQASNFLSRKNNNSLSNIYLYNRQTKRIEIVSVAENGEEGNGPSYVPNISSDGRYVVFSSDADNLVPGDTNRHGNVYHDGRDIFVRDMLMKKTVRASIGPSGIQANDASYTPAISADGRFVAFVSFATNLTSEMVDKKNIPHTLMVYVHDLKTGTTAAIVHAPKGSEEMGKIVKPSLSGDGHFIAFKADARFLPGGVKGASDIFVIENPLFESSPD